MSKPFLATKLYIPPLQPKVVLRPRLIERLNEGLHCKLTLISAPAGFGKTTLASEWVAGCRQRAAWLSLDEGDNDPTRFLTYLVAALQTLALSKVEGIASNIGEGVLGVLQSPQPPIESILTTLLNELTVVPDDFALVLDDYHVIDAKSIDRALAFLLEHLPPQMHLIIATREDPDLPLARLRTRGQLTELRAADLRFTRSEAAGFLNQAMSLNLSTEDIDTLETRTEGWIAGLQLAAISIQGNKNTAGFIKSFTGSHRFVMDYLVEEVLRKQSESVQNFLLRTSILDRLCGPLCDVVLQDPSPSGQKTLEYLEQANLFIVPLDNERRWYRYHHLFADSLRQRLRQSNESVVELHLRASAWYENNGLEIEAFHHAAAADDVDRAARVIAGKGIPLHVRGGLAPVLHWLESLPASALDARPELWVMYAGALTTAGQTTHVEQKLRAAENALKDVELNAQTRDLIGRIASNRATLAVTRYEADTALAEAERAGEYLHPENLPIRTINSWVLGVAYELKGERSASLQAFSEALSASQTIGHTFVTKLATIGLGHVLESDNRLRQAAETFRRALQLFGDQPLPIACEAHLGLARISYEWNDLNAAEQHGRQSIKQARQFADIIDRFVISEVFLARLKLAQGDAAGAAALLSRIDQVVRRNNFVHRIPEVAAAQVLVSLRQGNSAEAARLVETHNLPLSRARVCLALGDASAALKALEPVHREAETRGWADQRLQAVVLQAIALHAHGETERAMHLLSEALALAEPEGFIRIFVDEGEPMARLLSELAARGIMPDHIGKLLAAFKAEKQKSEDRSPTAQPLIEPLSQRELEVLRLIAKGLSNHEICRKLFLALPTVKGHNRNIFGKLQVQRRTEAVARARELGLL